MKAIIALCALLASIPVSAQQIHRWVDADGRVQYSDKPPPGVASKPVAVRINSYGGTPVVSGTASPAQAFLARQGIGYTHIDVEKSEAGRAEYRGLGGRGVPLIMVGTQRMTGFSEEGLAQMLKAAGY